jgi:hypothetical protein
MAQLLNLRKMMMYTGGMYHIPHGASVRAGPTKWDRSLADLQSLVIPTDLESIPWDAALMDSSTLEKLLPATVPIAEYKLLFAFQRVKDGRTIIKGAVQHRTTNKVANLTTHSQIPENAHVLSHVGGYYVNKADMVAPLCFWNAFKAC